MPRTASLEIHEMNVGQGDSILIVNRDVAALAAKIPSSARSGLDAIDYLPYALAHGIDLNGTVRKALLIDAGDDEYGGDVVSYLGAVGALRTSPAGYCPDLYLLVSHYHDDHLAGLRSVFKDRVVTPKVVGKKTVNVATLVPRFRPARMYQTTLDRSADPGTRRFEWFEGDVDGASEEASNPTERFFIDPGGLDPVTDEPTIIDLGTGASGASIQLIALCAGQKVYDAGTQRTVRIDSTGSKVDQNDRSVGLVLVYGSFRYFIGGDLAGSGGPPGGNTRAGTAIDGTSKRFFSVHADVESTLGPAIQAAFPKTSTADLAKVGSKYPYAGYCTVMKANHHASSSSVDTYFLSSLRPTVVLISSGVRSRFHNHPTQQVMNRVTPSASATWGVRGTTGTVPNSVKGVYVTEVADRHKGTTFATDLLGAKILGDIVVRPVDESLLAIYNATAGGQQLEVQVYGSGAQTGLASPGNSLRATVTKNTSGVYPIGPFYHTDTH